MSSPLYQAEDYQPFTGQIPHSHSTPPTQEYVPDPAVLSGVGTHFDSRKWSYDSTVDLSEDEATIPQPDKDATTPRRDHTSWLLSDTDASRAVNSPPTPRRTPDQGHPYLPPSEIPELQRQRMARERRKATFDPHRPTLEDTPRGSPDGTAYTSVGTNSEWEDDAEQNNYVHVQDDYSGSHTPSQRSFGSEENNGSYEQSSVLNQYLYGNAFHRFSEDGPEHTAGSMSLPWNATGINAPQDG